MSTWVAIAISGGIYQGPVAYNTKQRAINECIAEARRARESDDPEWHLFEIDTSRTGRIGYEMSFAFGFYDAYEHGPNVDPRALCIAEMEAAKAE